MQVGKHAEDWAIGGPVAVQRGSKRLRELGTRSRIGEVIREVAVRQQIERRGVGGADVLDEERAPSP
jgi:hypothetical protein